MVFTGRLLDIKMKALILIGAAPNTKEDFNNLIKIGLTDFDVLCVGKNSMKHCDQLTIKYFATYHPEDIPKNLDKTYQVICHKHHQGLVDIVKPIDLQKEASGSSALLGALVGIELGYKKIVLCGCPLEGKNPKGHPYEVFQKGWKEKENVVNEKVRSMSGWTKQFLGKPTIDWLEC